MLLALPALAPLARSGFFESHDGLLHVYRLEALDRAVRAGVLYPRWFPEFAFGYGHPVLNFYGPLSYYWGLPFTLLGADSILAVKLVFASGLLASGLAMYLFARSHLARIPALVAAVVYVYLPYHLVDLYVRGALAEFLAFAWYPLALWAFGSLVQPTRPSGLTRTALAALVLAALVATHSLSALIFAPVLLAYLALLLIRAGSWRPAARVAVALTLSVALSAFYWLPVLAESQFVGLGSSASQGYRDHLVTSSDLVSLQPAYGYPSESGATPTFPLGLAQLAILAAAPLLVFWRDSERRIALLLLGVGLASAFMLTAISEPVWRLLEPALAFLQYPWRFQALTALATAFLAGALCMAAFQALPDLPRWSMAAGLCLVVGASALWRLSPAPIQPTLSVETMWQQDRDRGQVGATWTGEYLPIWVQEQRWALARPLAEPAQDNGSVPAGQVQLNGVGYTRSSLTVDVPQGGTVTLHQFHYPGW
ncbi:MAG: 6-pyruvoyl-tetrahydropterin synthase-related protein, partial [Anaerolineae bacterium]|nr:6-pyruvoyl-tetrahydropterin synthase-related protein [Anaerolineae bacterium]